MLENTLIEQETIENLLRAINSVPNAHAEIMQRDVAAGKRYRPDALIEAQIAGRPLRLIVEIKRDVFPRDVREAIWQLQKYKLQFQPDEQQIIPFLVAGSISDGAREALRDEGIGYHDTSGTLFIPANGAYVYVDRPIPRKSRKIFDSIFQGQRAQVLQTIFLRRDDWLSVKGISDETLVSPATVSQTLKALERREWVESMGNGPTKLRRLSEPTKFVDAWAHFIQEQKPIKLKRLYVPASETRELLNRLEILCQNYGIGYAVTGEAAAQVHTPYLTHILQVVCRINSNKLLPELLQDLKARSVNDGWNLGLIETRVNTLAPIGQYYEGICFAYPLQIYLDLLQGSGRSKEMAAHFRSERLGV